MRNRRFTIVTVATCLILFIAGSTAASRLSIRTTSQSELPGYINDDGQLILDKVPAFVPVAERNGDGIAGFAAREDVYAEEFSPELLKGVRPGELPSEFTDPIPVYATQDGERLVGHVYTEIGYVSLEEARMPGFNFDDLRVDVDLFDNERELPAEIGE